MPYVALATKFLASNGSAALNLLLAVSITYVKLDKSTFNIVWVNFPSIKFMYPPYCVPAISDQLIDIISLLEIAL